MDVRLPNGVVLTNVPDTASKDEIRAKAIRAGLAKPEDFGETSAAVAQIPKHDGPHIPAVTDRPAQMPRMLDAAIQGAAAVPMMAGAARVVGPLFRGTRLGPYVDDFVKAVTPNTGKRLAAEGGIGAVAGVAAEGAARNAPAGWGPTGELLAGMGAGVAVGGAAGLAKNSIEAVTGGLFNSSKDVANQVAGQLGAGKAGKMAATALQANPNLAATVARSQEIRNATGIDLPALAASNGDTTISSYLQSQMAKGDNVNFTAAMKQQYEAAEQSLLKARNGAAPTMKEVDSYVKKKAAEVAKKNKEIEQKAVAQDSHRAEGLTRIDSRINDLTESLNTGATANDVGTRLSSLIEAKAAALKQEMGPMYDEVIKVSEAAGIRLPAESAENLRQFVLDKTSQDVFNKFPQLYRTISTVFKPEPVVKVSSKMAEKYTFAKPAAVTKDYSLKDLDSLKRETNEALRNTQRGTDQYRMLQELKQQVSAAIDSTAPEFRDAYRAIDKAYATRLGIPFHEAGVVKIDRARFVEDTVPMLTKRTSSLKQVLDVIGDDPNGLKVVEDAFLMDITNKRSIIGTSGQVNPAELRRYIAANKDKIDMVPGLRQRLEGVTDKVQELVHHRTQILDAQKHARIERVENLYSKAYGTSGGIRGLVRNAMNNPAELDKLVGIAAQDAAAKGGIKAALLDDILSAPGDRLEVLSANKQAFEKLFGAGETKHLTDIIEASQRLKDNPFKMQVNINTINKTQWQAVTGSRADTTLGEFRNQVMTAPRMVINHFTRYFEGSASKQEAAAVQDFLLNPKSLEDAALLMKELELRGFSERAKDLLLKAAKNSSASWLMGGLVGAGIGAKDRPARESDIPADMQHLIEGYGK